jgi:hypothetical protein
MRSGRVWSLLRDSPSRVCSFSGTGSDGLHLARFARARLRGLIGEADMTAVLALAGEVIYPGEYGPEGEIEIRQLFEPEL